MNITTIIELENKEVEEIAGAKLVFSQEEVNSQIVETCVECFKYEGIDECVDTEETMEKVFEKLKEKAIIPKSVTEFSYQMPSCEKMKKAEYTDADMPQKVILTFSM
ncbi:hypothetical protein [Bacillus massilinigeriensis]|uniref:hypothetical protein n=1 Tax=Bacillus mediterraneensis TaxID=1805474 RepID=UPI0008F81577|nr:hypothetical protein [Bacillus mediterraneensis]